MTTTLPLQISNEDVLNEIKFTSTSSILKARPTASTVSYYVNKKPQKKEKRPKATKKEKNSKRTS